MRKARLGMSATGLRLGVASEGTFGPHPVVPFMPAGMEFLVFVDDDRKIIITESAVSEATNFDHLVVVPFTSIEMFLERIGFPAHGLIVRPNAGALVAALRKGISSKYELDRAIINAASTSPDGKARLDTDMRAHFNPTRMNSLAALAQRLGRRLATLCSACGNPGLGRTETRHGLPCEDCDAPTQMIAAEIFSCPSCDFQEYQARFDGLLKAPVRYCPECNP